MARSTPSHVGVPNRPHHLGPPSSGGRGWAGQFLRFITIGLFNTAVELVLYNALLVVHETHSVRTLTVYSTLGVVAAVANSYVWNSRWAFREASAAHGHTTMRQRGLFALQALVGIAINDVVTALLTPAVTGSGLLPTVVAQNLAKVVAMSSSSLSSYLMLRWLVFSTRRPE